MPALGATARVIYGDFEADRGEKGARFTVDFAQIFLEGDKCPPLAMPGCSVPRPAAATVRPTPEVSFRMPASHVVIRALGTLATARTKKKGGAEAAFP